ncbi:MAG TPA: hypothetical protein VH419_12380, partial [Nocardioidaceae bacterium]
MDGPRRVRRAELLANRMSREQSGVAHRRQLYELGVTRSELRAQLDARRWRSHGRQTIGLHTGPLAGRAMYFRAVFETAGDSALDGVSALIDAGLVGFREDLVHVSVAKSTIHRRPRGVRVHETRRRYDGDAGIVRGLPRVDLAAAAIRAALWAESGRQASLILIMSVQQQIVTPGALHEAFSRVLRDRRRGLIKAVLSDLADGVRSMGELDFARMCRRRGLPTPSRQQWRRLPDGRACLDVYFDQYGVVVEI